MQEKVTYPEKPGLQLSARVKAGRTRFWVTSSQSNKRSIFFFMSFFLLTILRNVFAIYQPCNQWHNLRESGR